MNGPTGVTSHVGHATEIVEAGNSLALICIEDQALIMEIDLTTPMQLGVGRCHRCIVVPMTMSCQKCELGEEEEVVA